MAEKKKKVKKLDEKLFMYCLGFIDKLVAYGIFSGTTNLNDEGREKYQELIASGYEPDAEEAADCCQYILSGDFHDDMVNDKAKQELAKGAMDAEG